MWHQHILDVVNYCHDMMLLCGHVVGHNPDVALDVEGKKTRDKRTREALEEHYLDRYDKEIWGIQESEDSSDAESEDTANAVKNQTTEDSDDTHRDGECGADVDVFESEHDVTNVAGDTSASTRDKGKDEMTSITICFQGVDTSYTVKKRRNLSACFKEFARSKGKTVAQFEFTYMNRRITGRSSPNSLQYNKHEALYRNRKVCIYATLKAGISAAKSDEMLTNPSQHEQITIRLKDQSGEETFFKVKRITKMAKIFNAYATRNGVDVKTLRFLLDAEPICHHATPLSLELEDQDQIDVVLEQRGC
eukprot:CCRYP_012295-RA/>CCRYP_012295-RA protein AED:0.34 eAED:0.34 QI:0/-1/0/1/-1/1/1/0/305